MTAPVVEQFGVSDFDTTQLLIELKNLYCYERGRGFYYQHQSPAPLLCNYRNQQFRSYAFTPEIARCKEFLDALYADWKFNHVEIYG
jgi:hypothetical protein